MSDNRAIELKPCPFCGGEAEICHVRDICRDPQDWYWGKCLSCHISGSHYPTEAEAIAAWNSRTPIEYDGWFYLPKPKEGIVDYGEPEITMTEDGCKVRHIADVVDEAARRWGEELGEYVMQRICEIWSTHATQGTLTAEQVREAIFNGSSYASYDGAQYYANGISMQAIADELNSRAERTCQIEYVKKGALYDVWRCSSCGYEYAESVSEPSMIQNYCPNCGAKVVGE